MKKLSLLLFLLFAVLVFPNYVQAVRNTTATSSGTNNIIKNAEKIENIDKRIQVAEELKEKKISTLEAKKNQITERLRQAVISRYENISRLITKSEELLNKLQERINLAKQAGKNTAEAEKWMNDARLKLNSAKTKLSAIEGKKGNPVNKVDFRNLQLAYQSIHKDLNTVRIDAAKIISNLKAFNSASTSAVKKATTSATLR